MKQTSMFTSEDLPLFSQTPVPAIIPLVGTDSPYQPEPESNIEQLQLVADEIDTPNGYKIAFNEFWGMWQVSHPNIGACIAEFKTEAEAIEYCQAG